MRIIDGMTSEYFLLLIALRRKEFSFDKSVVSPYLYLNDDPLVKNTALAFGFG